MSNENSKPTKQDFISVFSALAEALGNYNDTAADGDRGSDNSGLFFHLWGDGSGRSGQLHFSTEDEQTLLRFDDFEALATWAIDYIGGETPTKPTLTTKQWVEAKQRFDRVRQSYLDLEGVPGVNSTIALRMVFDPIALRYNSGERTHELYDAMRSVK